MKKILLVVVILTMAYGCSKEKKEDLNVEGYKPIYIQKSQAHKIGQKEPQVLLSPGKMYLFNNYIYIVDFGVGIHIIDNTIPSKPNNIAFISIPGVQDVAVKNSTLLADNFTDLVSIDISNLSDIKETSRIKNFYPVENQFYPIFSTGYFECVDTTKGYVLRWEKANLTNPKCFR